MKKTLAPIAGSAAILLALTACGEQEETPAQPETQEETQVADAEAQDTDVPDDYTGRMTGPVDAVVGEPVEVDLGPFEGEGDFAGTVALSSVEFSDTCVYDARDGSTHETKAGQFVSLTFDIEADSDAEEPIEFSSNSFRWDDYHYSLSTPESLDCELDLGHQDPVEPGESGSYTAIWDVPSTAAELQWSDPAHTVTWQIDGNEPAEDSEETVSDAVEEHPDATEEYHEAPAEDAVADTCDSLQEEFDQLWDETNNAEPGSVDHDEFSEQINDIIDRQEAAGCLY